MHGSGQTKSQVDRAGRILSASEQFETLESLQAEETFDLYRTAHLPPLSVTTEEIQGWLQRWGEEYCIAQRLKRKPQILRKLRRFSVRLSQLQDIAGCRVIVRDNLQVEQVHRYLVKELGATSDVRIQRTSDYRERGRDTTGYRALHLILERDGCCIEVQIRSRIQHFWSENIERTSVIYGHLLKEGDGDELVIRYFQKLSDTFYEYECGRSPGSEMLLEIESLHRQSLEKIMASDKGATIDSYTHEGIIKTLADKERGRNGQLNNWILIFNWNIGSFVAWDIVDHDASSAVKKYQDYESLYRESEGYEVVLIGSSDIKTVRNTHSHYFGVEDLGAEFPDLRGLLVGLAKKHDLDIGARKILRVLQQKRHWGKNPINIGTLKNHYCKDVVTFDESLGELAGRGLIHSKKGISLVLNRKSEIDSYL